MRNHLVRTSISAIAIAGALSLGASGAEAQKKILRADTGSPGAVSHAVIVVLGKVWQKELGITKEGVCDKIREHTCDDGDEARIRCKIKKSISLSFTGSFSFPKLNIPCDAIL